MGMVPKAGCIDAYHINCFVKTSKELIYEAVSYMNVKQLIAIKNQ